MILKRNKWQPLTSYGKGSELWIHSTIANAGSQKKFKPGVHEGYYSGNRPVGISGKHSFAGIAVRSFACKGCS